MANYCANELRIIGKQSEIDDFMYQIKDLNGEVCFTTLLPTPQDTDDSFNWEYNNYGVNRTGGIESYFQDNYISFETAWSPPEQFFENVSKLYPNLVFELTYCEITEAYCGITIFKNGERLLDEDDEIRSQLARDLFGDEFVDEILEEDIDDE